MLKLSPLTQVEEIENYVKKNGLGEWKDLVEKSVDDCIEALDELSGESEGIVRIAEKMEAVDQNHESNIKKIEELDKSVKGADPREKEILEEIFNRLKDQHDALGILVKMGKDIMQCAEEETKVLEQIRKDADELSEEAPKLGEYSEKHRKRLERLFKIFGFLLLREKAEISVLTDTEKEEIKEMEARSMEEIRNDTSKIVADVKLILSEQYSKK
jgi:hypothetical protein